MVDNTIKPNKVDTLYSDQTADNKLKGIITFYKKCFCFFNISIRWVSDLQRCGYSPLIDQVTLSSALRQLSLCKKTIRFC